MVILTIGARAKFFGEEIIADEFVGTAAARSLRATNFRKRPAATRGSILCGEREREFVRAEVRGRG